jgi:hypothetical protein
VSRKILLDVPILRQQNWCSCGLTSVNMVLRHHGLTVTERALEKHPLVRPNFLNRHGFGPGRLARIALSFGFAVTLIEPDPREAGRRFTREGGHWLRRSPAKSDLVEALDRRIPAVACIPDTGEAFGGTRHGSHWVVVRGLQRGDLVIHDPAPWRRAVRCVPGYWDDWRCSLILIQNRPNF